MTFVLATLVLLAAIVVVVVLTVRALIVICPPNKVAVVSGRSRGLQDGRSVGYRVIKGGRTLRVPMLERVDFMDLNTIPIEVSVTNAYSKGAIPLDVMGVANIKVSSREGVLENSVERFLGRETSYIQQIAKENLEANLRGVLSTLTPEEVNEDRLKFAQTLIDEADDDIRTLGLELDVLKIQNVTDQVGYLEAVGRRRTAQVLREARESEAKASAEAEEAEATGRERAELARVHANLAIAEESNKLRVRQAELDSLSLSEEARAKVAAQEARVRAEQVLEHERIELQRRRLEANVVAPARAQKEALELVAKGEAAKIIEDGAAQISVFRDLSEEYSNAGPDANDVYVLRMLPELVEQITDTVKGIDIDKITVIDNGGGGGNAVPGVASQMPAAVIAITEQIHAATGVNILDVLNRQKEPTAPAGITPSATIELDAVQESVPAIDNGIELEMTEGGGDDAEEPAAANG